MAESKDTKTSSAVIAPITLSLYRSTLQKHVIHTLVFNPYGYSWVEILGFVVNKP